MNSSRSIDTSDSALIQKVKETPSLYDPLNPDFKFAFRKDQIWAGVASYLGITTNDARRRWTCLRDRYSRELKLRSNNPQKADCGPDEFFNTMDFLRRFVRRRRVRRRIVCSVKDNNWDSSNDAANQMSVKSNSRKQKKEQLLQEDDQDSYPNKMELASAGVEESYQEYVEDESQLCEPFEEYHAQQNETDNPSVENYINTTNKSPVQASASSIIAHSTDVNQNKEDQGMQPAQTVSNTNWTVVPKREFEPNTVSTTDTEDDFFCKSIYGYLRQLSRVHKIKAKVEMYQILEKYIEIEESQPTNF